MVIDLRSDTVTQPTPAMRRAMAGAEVGDDQYGEDPTVRALQEEFAERVGKPAALYVPSGVMANQLAIRVLTRPGDAVVAGTHQHVVAYEYGAAARNAGVQFLPLPDGDGMISEAEVRACLRGSVYHRPKVGLVSLENTHMAAGGRVWGYERFCAIAAAAGEAGVPVHLDGARLWHAETATGRPVKEWAEPVSSVMCCLSKGLCAPVGSVLAGPTPFIEAATEERHRLGGAMRQVGVIAAAGRVALATMSERLGEDHRHAVALAETIRERWPGCGLDPAEVQTNIVIFTHPDPPALIEHLRHDGVLAGSIGPQTVRLVTHYGIEDAEVDVASKALRAAPA